MKRGLMSPFLNIKRTLFMKKVLSYTLASLALAALCAPAFAGQFGGSIRGDVGPTGSQVPYYGSTALVNGPSLITQDTVTFYSDRKEGVWDFTGRLFFYTSCAPCPTYIAGSWQGSKHTVNSSTSQIESPTLLSVIPVLGPLDVLGLLVPFAGSVGELTLPGSPVAAAVSVKNEFSKAKLGFGMDLIKTCCFSFTMEVGASYLDAKLDTEKVYGITQTVAQGPGAVPLIGVPQLTGVVSSVITLIDPLLAALPLDYTFNVNEYQKTEGLGMYAMFKGEYKFPASCFGNCFSVYGKAEVADIIGRQNYTYDFNFLQTIGVGGVVLEVPTLVSYQQHPDNRYNNIVEVDLEAALVYSPCFKCWDDLHMSFALGLITDKFLNVFSHPVGVNGQSIMSLTRPTVFLEVGIKV